MIFSKMAPVHLCGACAPVTQRARVRSPVGTNFLGEVFSGLFLTCKTNVGKLWTPGSPNIIWLSLSSSVIFHYGCQWPEMLTRPENLNIHTYIHASRVMAPFTSLVFRNLHFSCLKCISSENILCTIIKFRSVVNNILVHNPVEQIINIMLIIVMDSKYI